MRAEDLQCSGKNRAPAQAPVLFGEAFSCPGPASGGNDEGGNGHGFSVKRAVVGASRSYGKFSQSPRSIAHRNDRGVTTISAVGACIDPVSVY